MGTKYKDLRTAFNEYSKGYKNFETKENTEGLEPKVKPSMIGTPCERKAFYSFNQVNGVRTPMELKSKRIMLLGDYVEDMLVQGLREAGVIIDAVDPQTGRTPLWFGEPNPQFRLQALEFYIKHAFIDIVAELDDGIWICDTKSKNADRYREVEDLPPQKDLWQIVLYFYIFRRNLKRGDYDHIERLAKYKEEGPRGIRVWYYNKNNSYTKEVVYTPDGEVFKAIIERIERIYHASISEELPPKTKDYCNSCEFKRWCDEEDCGFTYDPELNKRFPKKIEDSG